MRNLAFKYRGHRWHGVDIGEREARIWGTPMDIKGKMFLKAKDLLLNRVRLSALELTEDKMYEFYKKCLSFKPKLIYGYATALYEFARFISQESLNGKAIGVKVIISTSEVLYDSHKEVIESVFGCKVFNEYGSVETGIIAFECPHGNMHICTEGVYVEFLDDRKLDINMTELVITNLYNKAMPLIRYRLGDAGYYLGSFCNCGRTLPLMELKIAKVVDFVQLPNGRVFSGELFDYINLEIMKKNIKGIKQFKVFQESITKFRVQILKDEDFSSTCLDIFEAKMKRFLGDNIEVLFEFPGNIPREPSGKLRYFVSRIS